MRSFIAGIALLVSTSSYAANPYDLRAVRVIDGDTITIDAPFLPVELRRTLSLRIYGVDTPEKGSLAKCDSERQRGEAATRFTQRVVASAKKQQVVFIKWDKYGGRVLGDMLLDGQSLKKLLIDNGHAREYDGGKKSSWCQ
jgi:endonuclease YncB( thermonuclease family)